MNAPKSSSKSSSKSSLEALNEPVKEALNVSTAEAGQKLLAFLARRVAAPQSMLHKWIRSGQVRINGLRVKAFQRVALADKVRVPPFAVFRDLQDTQGKTLPLPPCVYEDEHIMLLHKPAGLPVHPGTGHVDSISTRLSSQYAHYVFVPTPAHRLDKATSGLLVVGKTYTGLRAMQDLFARRTTDTFPNTSSGTPPDTPFEKTYLAWLCGVCPWDTPTKLEHRLAKQVHGAYERVGEHQNGQLAHSVVTCISKIVAAQKTYSLVQVQLLTGRTHQIRAQMAIMGFPLVGDRWYGGDPFASMLLHAYRLVLPQGRFEVPPAWPAPFAIDF